MSRFTRLIKSARRARYASSAATTRFADGHQRRDLVYVDDVVDVLHFALSAEIPRGIVNLATGRARTFLDLARATFAALGVAERISFVPMPEGLAPRYQYVTEACVERLRMLGFERPFTARLLQLAPEPSSIRPS